METDAGSGTQTQNLSPFGIAVQTILRRKPDKILEMLEQDKITFKLLLPQEIEIPEDLKDIIDNPKVITWD